VPVIPASPARSALLWAGTLALSVVVAGCSKPHADVLPESSLPLVSTVVPHRSALDHRLQFTGTISARYDLPIGVEGEGGRIAQVLVEAGERVHQGQVLARLDPSVVAAQVASLEASLEEARANAELALADSRRAEAVAPAGALSKEEVERRRSAATTAAAKVKVAAAQLAEAQGRLARLDVKAPADGVVLTRHAEIGQTATPGGDPLFRLAKNGEVELRGQVAEQDIPHLRVGQAVTVRITGVERAFDGQIWQVGAVIDPQSRLGSVRVALKPDPDLRPGAFARADLSIDHDEKIVVPQTAVLSDGEGSYVFVLGDANQVVRRPVKITGTGAAGVIVGSGLTGEEHVITMAGSFLREGETVRRAPETIGTPASTTAPAAPAAPAKGR
jgi:HlyD family secretion protein